MSIEAMKQALEALEGIHPGNMTPMAEESWKKAITSLRQAIEQAEKPVAWMRQDGQRVTTASNRHNYPDGETRYSIPLYTTPQPQRQWVGLTKDEMDDCECGTYYQTCKALEAKLKEKNVAI